MHARNPAQQDLHTIRVFIQRTRMHGSSLNPSLTASSPRERGKNYRHYCGSLPLLHCCTLPERGKKYYTNYSHPMVVSLWQLQPSKQQSSYSRGLPKCPPSEAALHGPLHAAVVMLGPLAPCPRLPLMAVRRVHAYLCGF
uniref:Uncharacterized protein n=1 Tax=Arundo donax TaxID=35708 RepID=A0A0A9GEG8_ARUDO